MAAFAHLNPMGSRFSDGTYGVSCAANNLATAIAETRLHHERFLTATAEPPMELDMRVYLVDVDGDLHELRGQMASQQLVYHNDNYAAGQHLARSLREAGSNGIAYDSLRRPGGKCVAVFRPTLLSNARQERQLCYVGNVHIPRMAVTRSTRSRSVGPPDAGHSRSETTQDSFLRLSSYNRSRFFRMDSPLRLSPSALWTCRSRMASASMGSPANPHDTELPPLALRASIYPFATTRSRCGARPLRATCSAGLERRRSRAPHCKLAANAGDHPRIFTTLASVRVTNAAHESIRRRRRSNRSERK